MKKFLSALFLVILVSVTLTNYAFSKEITIKTGTSSYTYQGPVYNLELNGLWVPTVTPCVVISNFAYVPLREVFQDYLGLNVGYDDSRQVAYVTNGSKIMEYSFKEQAIYQNGKKLDTTLPVASIDGNIMVPLSRTADYFGFTAGVKSDNKTLTIQWSKKDDAGTVIKDKAVSGTVKKISFYTDGGKEFVFIETSAKKIEKQFVLKPMEGNPYYRLCVQFSDAYIDKPGNLDVYAGSVQQIRFAQTDNANNIASIVIEVDHNPEYTVNAVSNGIQIAIASVKNSDNTSEPNDTQQPSPTPTPTPTPVQPQVTPTPVPSPSPAPTPMPKPTAAPTPVPTAVPTPAPTPVSAPVVGNGAIHYTMDGDSCVVFLDGIDLNEKIKENPDQYKVEYRTIEKILQIRMPLNQDFKTEVIPGNSILNGIISFCSKTRNEVNIRIAGKNELSYVIASNGNSGTKIIFNPGGIAYNPTPTPTPVSNQPIVTPTPEPVPENNQPKVTPTPTTTPSQPKVTPTPTPTHTPTAKPSPVPTPPPGGFANRGEGDRSGTISFVAGTNKIIIDTIALENYKIFRLANPSRIVIDIPQNLIEAREYNYPSGYVYSKIRTGQFETTTARMVIEADENIDWEDKQDGKTLTVTLMDSGIKNLHYTSKEDNAALKLTSPGIRQLMEKNMDKIEVEDDKKSGTFTFIFPDGIIDLGSGKIQAGEKNIHSVHTLTTGNKAYLSIKRENSGAIYKLSFTDSNDEVLIVLSDGTENQQSGNTPSPSPTPAPTPKPEQDTVKSGKLIVLDAGHGGSEAGATYGKEEKWYNLDITLKTAAILREKGVNVKLTREKDEFVSLYDRAKMANDWNADLFVSIHNNAFFDKNTSGTMTFFYTGSYKGKEYATIIQNDLLKNLGSKDIGVRSQNYVVIRDTKMPAVLVEIGCLSNDEERAKLDTEEYRMKAAQSLAESILKIIPKL